jgi:hypothetical protein
VVVKLGVHGLQDVHVVTEGVLQLPELHRGQRFLAARSVRFHGCQLLGDLIRGLYHVDLGVPTGIPGTHIPFQGLDAPLTYIKRW